MAKINFKLKLHTGNYLLTHTGDNILLSSYYYFEDLIASTGMYVLTGYGLLFNYIRKVLLNPVSN